MTSDEDLSIQDPGEKLEIERVLSGSTRIRSVSPKLTPSRSFDCTDIEHVEFNILHVKTETIGDL